MLAWQDEARRCEVCSRQCWHVVALQCTGKAKQAWRRVALRSGTSQVEAQQSRRGMMRRHKARSGTVGYGLAKRVKAGAARSGDTRYGGVQSGMVTRG